MQQRVYLMFFLSFLFLFFSLEQKEARAERGRGRCETALVRRAGVCVRAFTRRRGGGWGGGLINCRRCVGVPLSQCVCYCDAGETVFLAGFIANNMQHTQHR